MNFDPILPPARVRAMRQHGYWTDRLLIDHFDASVARVPDKTAVVDHNSMAGRGTRLSFRELDAQSRRLALLLVRLGVEKSDVVSCQLPNWWQFTALALACTRIGAVLNPLMPIFRERELSFMLALAESKVFIVPRMFRNFDHAAMAGALRAGLPRLAHVLVIGGEGPFSFEAALESQAADGGAAALFAARRPHADEVTQLLFTSGTTGEPKGVMHTSNTLLSILPPYVERLRLATDDIVLMASPLAHQTGYMYGMMLPLMLGATSVLQDIWDAKRAAATIAQERVTYTMASTPFLSDLTEAVEAGAAEVTTLRVFQSAGAPIPRVLVGRAMNAMRCKVLSGWGMTENGAVTTTKPDDPPEKIFHTDGCPVGPMEVAVFDAENRRLPAGQEGRLKARGCSNFVGYLKRPHLYGTDAEGWFETGDLARIDADGYIRITGRSKDIIIRGGENIPVVEIEGLLYRHPAVQDVAVVGMPDARLGERACAFVVLKAGANLTLRDVTDFLIAEKVAKNYFPERLEVLEQMPRTPSGKIQKFKLRELVGGETKAALSTS